MTNRIFEEVFAVSGLSPLFGRNALERAIQRAGLDPSKLTRADLATALPEIERTIRTFLPDEAEEVLERLRRIGR